MNDLAPVQTAIYEALTAAPATYPVYDAVPQGAAFPYLVIGEWTAQPDEILEVASTDADVMIHAWSRHPGKLEAHQLLQFVRARLDGQAIGGGVWACSEEFSTVMEDRNSTAANRLFHAAARYRVRLN